MKNDNKTYGRIIVRQSAKKSIRNILIFILIIAILVGSFVWGLTGLFTSVDKNEKITQHISSYDETSVNWVIDDLKVGEK